MLSSARVGRLAACLWLTLAPPALSRPFTVDDLIGQATFGAAAFDPSGRFLVYEVRPPYRETPRFDQGDWNGRNATRLVRVDLAAKGAARPTPFHGEAGLAIGPFAPAGARLAVFQLRGERYRLGVAQLRDGTIRWFDVTPLDGPRARTLAWRTDTVLLALVRSDEQGPEYARRGWVAAERLMAAWQTHARGGSARTILGSGAYANLRERPAPMRLIELDTVSGRRRELARGPYVDFELSPDGRRVALLRTSVDLQSSGDRPVRGEAGSETEAHGLEILDLASGQRVSSPLADVLPQLLAWSPSSQRLLVFSRRPGMLWTEGALQSVDADSGKATPVGDGLEPTLDLNPVRVWADWMGDEPLVFGRPTPARGGRSDWFRLSSQGPVNLTAGLPAPDRLQRLASPSLFRVIGGGGLWSVDRTGVHVVREGDASPGIEPDADLATTRIGRGPFTQLWLRLGTSASGRLSKIDATRVEALPWEFAQAAPWDAVGDAGALRREVEASGVERLWLTRAGGRVDLLQSLNAGLGAAETPDVVPVTHRGPSAEVVTSWLFLPAHSARPAPLLVRPYLGANYRVAPLDRPPPSGFILNIRLLTSHGYAVLVPSLPNPPGGMTDPALGLADRILAVVEAARRTPDAAGRFDAERMGLIGFSFGGYSVMTAITQTSRFKAAVSVSGVSDLTSYWSSQSPFAFLDPQAGYVGNRMTGLVEATQPRMLGPPWRELDRYNRNSPLLAADRIETPLLLFHGALDPIPHAGSSAMYSALFRQGKDAEFVTYWGALHGVSSPGDVRDMYDRMFAFLDERLALGAPASPASALTGGRGASAPRPRSQAAGSASDVPTPRSPAP